MKPPKPLSREAVVEHNLKCLQKLDPLKVGREWCRIDKEASGDNWQPRKPAEWFWEMKGLVADFEEPSRLGPGFDLVRGAGIQETFKTEEGWRFETAILAEINKIRQEEEEAAQKEERGIFESTVTGITELARQEKLIRVTQHDVKLYLYENDVDLGSGMIGMLTLAVNRRLGAKERKRETNSP